MASKAKPALVTECKEFPGMVVMAVDNRLAAFILRCIGKTDADEQLSESLFHELNDVEEVRLLTGQLRKLGVGPSSPSNLSQAFDGTEWEVLK